MLKLLRRSVAAIVFVAFLCAFQDVGGRALVRLAGWQVIPALLALDVIAILGIFGITALFGRFYCSMLCPFGILQDFISGIAACVGYRPKLSYARSCAKTRWIVFALCLLCVLAGFTALPALIFPYSAFGRIASALFAPAASAVMNLIASAFDAFDVPLLMKQEVFVKGAMALAVAATSLLAIAAIAVLKGRWFCNAICPAGTLLSAASARPLLRLKIDSAKCVKCGMCERQCKAQCIDMKNGTIDNARCVRCMNCISSCAKGAVKW